MILWAMRLSGDMFEGIIAVCIAVLLAFFYMVYAILRLIHYKTQKNPPPIGKAEILKLLFFLLPGIIVWINQELNCIDHWHLDMIVFGYVIFVPIIVICIARLLKECAA